MHFRAQKKLEGEVSLSDTIDTDKEGNALELMDIVGVEDTMLDDLHDRDSAVRVRQLVQEQLSPRESEIIRLRYGLGGTMPLTQREVAAAFGISRSYVSRRHECKRCPESLENTGLSGHRSCSSRAAGIVNGEKFRKISGHSSILISCFSSRYLTESSRFSLWYHAWLISSIIIDELQRRNICGYLFFTQAKKELPQDKIL